MSLFLKEFVSSLICEILEEDKFSDAIKQNPDIAQELEKYFKGTKPKYLPWIVKQLKDIENAEGASSEWYEDLALNINDFDQLTLQHKIKEKDINKYDVEGLSIETRNAKQISSKTQIKKKAKKDVDVIYNDQEWLILEPQSTEASCYYGYGTKWCISAKLNNAFQGYHKSGIRFLFVIDKKDNKKFAISLSPDEQPYVYNDNDDVLEVEEFAKTYITQNILDIINLKTKEITGEELYRNITVADVLNNPIEELKDIKSIKRILPKMHHSNRMKVLIDVGKYALEHDISTIQNSENIRHSYRDLFEHELADTIPNDNSYEELLLSTTNFVLKVLGLNELGIKALKYKIFLKQQGIKDQYKFPGSLAFPFFFLKEKSILKDLFINMENMENIINKNTNIHLIDEKREYIMYIAKRLKGISKLFEGQRFIGQFANYSQQSYEYSIYMSFSSQLGEPNFSKNELKNIEMLSYWNNLFISSGYDLETLIKL